MTKRKAVTRITAKTKKTSPEEELAVRCSTLQAQLMQAGRSLHDHAGPLLSAAGIHLQLLKMDLPKAASRIQEVTKILEQALENVRKVSQDLAPSPVFRGGLERALARLAEEVGESVPVDVVVDYEEPADSPHNPLGRNDVDWLKHTLWFSETNSVDYKPVKLKPLTTESIPLAVRSF